MTLALCVTGCENAASQAALCDGSARLRTNHAAALAKDGGDLSLSTGAALIKALDSVCELS